MARHHLRRSAGTSSPCPGSIGIEIAEQVRQRGRPRARGEHEVSPAISPDAVRTSSNLVSAWSKPVASAPSTSSTPIVRSFVAEARDERVRLDVPLRLEVEPSLDAVVERRLELVDLLVPEHVVGKVVAVCAHPLEAAEHLARRPPAFSVAQTMPSFQRSNVIPSATISSTSSKDRLPERGERARAAVVVALVAVRPEAHEPGREPREVARGGSRAPSRASAGRGARRPSARAPGAARPGPVRSSRRSPRTRRCGSPTCVAVDERHLDVALSQVVGAAEAGDATADDDDLHDGIPAVTSISIEHARDGELGDDGRADRARRRERLRPELVPARRSPRRAGGSTAPAARARGPSPPRRARPGSGRERSAPAPRSRSETTSIVVVSIGAPPGEEEQVAPADGARDERRLSPRRAARRRRHVRSFALLPRSGRIDHTACLTTDKRTFRDRRDPRRPSSRRDVRVRALRPVRARA